MSLDATRSSFRWTPAPAERLRVWLLAALLVTLAAANLATADGRQPEQAPLVRPYDPLLSW